MRVYSGPLWEDRFKPSTLWRSATLLLTEKSHEVQGDEAEVATTPRAEVATTPTAEVTTTPTAEVTTTEVSAPPTLEKPQTRLTRGAATQAKKKFKRWAAEDSDVDSWPGQPGGVWGTELWTKL